MEGPPDNDFCSVCHGEFNLPCQANCSHWYCSHCILQVWNHSSALNPCKCPLCRRAITMLIPTDAALRQRRSSSSAAETLEKVERYNRLFGQRTDGIIQKLHDLPFLLRRLFRDMMNPQTTLPLVIKARVYIAVILSALYVLSPVDLIPEGLLGVVGLLDDLLIVLICFLHVAAAYRSVLLFRHGGS